MTLPRRAVARFRRCAQLGQRLPDRDTCARVVSEARDPVHARTRRRRALELGVRVIERERSSTRLDHSRFVVTPDRPLGSVVDVLKMSSAFK
jgi:hypothetical protein